MQFRVHGYGGQSLIDEIRSDTLVNGQSAVCVCVCVVDVDLMRGQVGH